MSIEALRVLLHAGCLWLALGLVAGAVARARARRLVGDVLHTAPAPSRWRAGLALLHLPAAALLLGAASEVREPGLGLLVLSLGTLLLSPAPDAGILGLTGVQRGWRARSFAGLEEWRMSEGHLHFRLGGDWLAVECPPLLQPRVRGLLARAAPADENRLPS